MAVLASYSVCACMCLTVAAQRVHSIGRLQQVWLLCLCMRACVCLSVSVCRAMYDACRLQQVRSLWSDIPHIQKAVAKLTPECMDLLNKIFVVDDKKRITIDHIKEHPWSACYLPCTAY